MSRLAALKRFFSRALPGPYIAAQARWRRFREDRFQRRLGRLVDALVDQHGLTVRSGPFAGMTYVSRAVSSALAPKLLGSYEAELHQAVEQAIRAGYEVVVDVGCAEGYYAVGLARALPTATVYAFDVEPAARELCAELARANGVADRVVIGGRCDAATLATLPLPGALLICDAEGGEIELLRPDAVPGLRACDLLVELHDCLVPGIGTEVTGRFAATHEIALLQSGPRDPGSYSDLAFLPEADRRLALDELRFPTTWAVMMAR